ncbi:hypothetical protein HK096_008541 [Nowakowskiella sp. JEL0078]|nr:hypothetical protein HK096_008541 [Nowakowskiella sp. JEL0078]
MILGNSESRVFQVGGCSISLNIPRNNYEIWSKLWGSSFVLIELLSQIHLEGLEVLELGSGLGIVGIYAALRGANVHLTDASSESLEAAQANAMINCVRDRSSTLKLNWKDALPVDLERRFDLVVAADVTYLSNMLAPLARTIAGAIKPITGGAVVVDPGRCFSDEFEERCLDLGQSVILSRGSNVETPVCVCKDINVFVVGNELIQREVVAEVLARLSNNSSQGRFGYCFSE